MDINLYLLEVITKTRLAEFRADAARYTVLASLRPPKRSFWAALLSRGQVLHSRIAVPDSAPRTSGRRGRMLDFKT